MAVSDKYVSVAMEIDPTAWIFRIIGNSSHKNLDRRDGNERDFRADYDHSDGSMESLRQKRAGREMAVEKLYSLSSAATAHQGRRESLCIRG
mmetsp:Transcript_27959/g.47506  ORF Transcript_27959/g.47506 Transcript_27959/m.47506 type:complete len:92 (-) Transcript_27959:238-513(-)